MKPRTDGEGTDAGETVTVMETELAVVGIGVRAEVTVLLVLSHQGGTAT